MKRSRKIILLAGSIIATVIMIVLTFGNQGFLDMHRLHKADKSRTAEIVKARTEIDSLKAEIERLKNDTIYIEKIARERLGMARKGEKIFKFIEESE